MSNANGLCEFNCIQIILGVYNLPNGDEIDSMYQELFVKTVIDFILYYRFNGLDVNWTYTKERFVLVTY